MTRSFHFAFRSFLLLFLFVNIRSAFAQCDPTMPQEVPWVKIPVSPSKVETIYGDEIYPRMSFSIFYPEMIRTDFIVTNVKHNGKRVYLSDWCYDQTLVDDPDVISQRSTTKPFVVSTGDDISFFRELIWWNLFDDPLLYYAQEDWEFQVVLEDAETGEQLATLDKIKIAAQPEPGYPSVECENPPAAVIHYTIPPELDARSVVLRFISTPSRPMHARFRRFDKMGIRFPEFRTQMDPSALLLAWKAGFWPPKKYNGKQQNVRFDNHTLQIAPDISMNDLLLNVYTSNGKKILSKKVRAGEKVDFNPPQSGTYQVELVENGRILSFSVIHAVK